MLESNGAISGAIDRVLHNGLTLLNMEQLTQRFHGLRGGRRKELSLLFGIAVTAYVASVLSNLQRVLHVVQPNDFLNSVQAYYQLNILDAESTRVGNFHFNT
jgi:hypothetical protein